MPILQFVILFYFSPFSCVVGGGWFVRSQHHDSHTRCHSVFPNLGLSSLANIHVVSAWYLRSQPSSMRYLLRSQGFLRPVHTEDAGPSSEVNATAQTRVENRAQAVMEMQSVWKYWRNIHQNCCNFLLGKFLAGLNVLTLRALNFFVNHLANVECCSAL